MDGGWIDARGFFELWVDEDPAKQGKKIKNA
jgi:hypothetical protein